ncbi:CueP family metal-binding protein [Oceanobacillus rekensis]|uniref:CueP family metal-binding protein n=1 Tax=Oceanobacillus rekensis TaxID=937927 RepID=UPI000B43C074|nr:CueP family metal-binding protein [Oceanobacillus rekensis]
MNLKIFAIAILAAVVLTACGADDTVKGESSQENETENMKELVRDYSTGNLKAEAASITSHQLMVNDNNGNELVYDLPADDFFVSIAPYVNETHPCTNHSLTSCQGEMTEEVFDIYIEDMEGNVIIDETMKSQSNGFVDLWLPRDKTYRVKIKHEGQMIESELSTFKGDKTCITTMQLM